MTTRWFGAFALIIALLVYFIVTAFRNADRAQAQATDDWCRGRFALARTIADSQAVVNDHGDFFRTGSSVCATYLGRQLSDTVKP